MQKRAGESRQRYKKGSDAQQLLPSPRFRPSRFVPPIQNDDDGVFSNSFEQDRYRTPFLFEYLTYTAPEDIMRPPLFGQ